MKTQLVTTIPSQGFFESNKNRPPGGLLDFVEVWSTEAVPSAVPETGQDWEYVSIENWPLEHGEVARADWSNAVTNLSSAIFVSRLASRGPLAPRNDLFEENYKAFQSLLPVLVQDPRYEGKYVAVLNGRLLDSDDDMQALIRRIYAHHAHEPVYVGRASRNIPRKELPSPERI